MARRNAVFVLVCLAGVGLGCPRAPAEAPPAGSAPDARKSMYDDPGNLPSYPCKRPDAGFGRMGLLDGGSPGDASSTRDPGAPVNGSLPPELIQRIVRDHFGAFRSCYEGGLKRNANLAGRVTIQFVIARSGAVEEAHPVCTTLADDPAVRCIADGFARLKFPEPSGGIVTVVYPIMFNPVD